MSRGYCAVYLRHARRTCRPGGPPPGGRPGFNEDRRICPIKTSYKDPSGVDAHSQNIESRLCRGSLFLSPRYIGTYLPLSLSLSLSGSAFRAEHNSGSNGRQGFMELVSSCRRYPRMSCGFYCVIGQNTTHDRR